MSVYKEILYRVYGTCICSYLSIKKKRKRNNLAYSFMTLFIVHLKLKKIKYQ